MLPDLNRLGNFYWIYKCGGVTAAARQLHVTRAAVSQSLAKLEAEIGTPLFVRTTKDARPALVPTESAQDLYSLVEPLVEGLASRLNELESAAGEISGVIRFSTPNRLLVDRLIPILARFRELHPRVRFEIMPSGEDVPSLLESDKLDFSFVDSVELLHPGLKNVIKRKLLRERAVMACSKTYFKSALGSSTAEARVLSARFISYQRSGTDIQSWIQAAYGKRVELRTPAIYMDSVFAVRRAVELGLGLGYVTRDLIEDQLASGVLVELKPKIASHTNEISVIELKGKRPPPAVAAFLKFLIPALEER